MLAYAPRPERRRFSPTALALIIGAHAAALALVMSARMETSSPFEPVITRVRTIPIEPDPEPVKPDPNPSDQPIQSQIDRPIPVIDPVITDGPVIELPPIPAVDLGSSGTGSDPVIIPEPPIARTGPRFITPAHLLKPPYPEERRRLDQEASLKLRLSIAANGRVVAVEPVGRADPAFLEAARRHILKAWRYRPATEGGQAIASSTVITLKFELD